MVNELKAVSSSVKNVMINDGNAYAVPFARYITNAPVDYSWFAITDEAVPFYQIVYHGLVNMSGTPVNLSYQTDSDVLKAIEYGCGLLYQVTYSDSSVLKSTEYDSNFSSGYRIWFNNMKTGYKNVNNALKDVQNSFITGHAEVAPDVYETVYDNGVRIYVNYNDTAVQVNDVTVTAKGYREVRGECVETAK